MKSNPPYAQVSYAFVGLPVVNLTTFCNNVAVMMPAATPVYDNPTPTIAELVAKITEVNDLTQQAINRDRLAIANRNAAQAELITMMRELGAFVQVKCRGDLPTLLSSGFEARATGGGSVGQLPAPVSVSLSLTGNSGEVLVKWPRIPNAATSTVYVATEPDGLFVAQPACTSSRCTLTGLTPLKPIYVKVCGNGSFGEGVLSSVMTIVVV